MIIYHKRASLVKEQQQQDLATQTKKHIDEVTSENMAKGKETTISSSCLSHNEIRTQYRETLGQFFKINKELASSMAKYEFNAV